MLFDQTSEDRRFRCRRISRPAFRLRHNSSLASGRSPRIAYGERCSRPRRARAATSRCQRGCRQYARFRRELLEFPQNQYL
jgi:hypothetical protein